VGRIDRVVTQTVRVVSQTDRGAREL
jgi:hypothetical protein